MDAGTPSILCCMCGVVIPPNPANTCAQCLQSKHDISEQIMKNCIVCRCKGCERYQKDNGGWVGCKPESRELLALCLRKIKGMKTVKLVDAAFVWCEEHSRRIKTKLTVQKEVSSNVILQESFVVEFVVRNRMCEHCHRTEANMTWNSVVQVRQKVRHKRTFLFLEQLIIKHNAYDRTVSIKPQPDGVDFYFAARNDAVRFLDFLESVVPMRSATSKKIVSLDTKSNCASFNYNIIAELVPVCKDDLVCLPKAVAAKFGGISPLVLCITVGNSLRFIDPRSCQICEMDSQRYWIEPFKKLLSSQRLQEFVVLDTTPLALQDASTPAHVQQQGRRPKKRSKRRRNDGVGSARTLSSRHRLAEVEVARVEDLGTNDTRYTVVSHLGHLFKPGDSALGYIVSGGNYNDDNLDELQRGGWELPDVVLVRKHFPKYRSKKKERSWKLKAIAADAPDQPGVGVGVATSTEEGRRDMELFMRDLEEDVEMRSTVNLYRRAGRDCTATSSSCAVESVEEDDVEEDAPTVPLDELLDDMTLDDADAPPDGTD